MKNNPLKPILSVFLLLGLFLAGLPVESLAGEEQVQARIKEAGVEVRTGAKAYFTVEALIPNGHHAYLNRGDDGFFIPMGFDLSSLEKGGYKAEIIKKPKGAREEKVRATVLRGKGEFRFALEPREISPISSAFKISMRSQICNDLTNICYPPEDTPLSLPVSFVGGATAPAPTGESSQKKIQSESTTPSEVAAKGSAIGTNAQKQEGEGLKGLLLSKYREYSKNILFSFLLMIVAGLMAAATPCVYPMLPITSAILMKRGGETGNDGFRHSFFYFFGIILTYMILGYMAGMTGGALNTIMRSAAVNLLFAVFFALFGLAMCGFYDLSFGEDFHARIDAQAGKKAGLTGTFLMGMVAGIVVSPCVGPVVFALLIQVADQIAEINARLVAAGQDLSIWQKSFIALKGGILMGGFGMGIGTPFLLVGIYSNRMPKAGTWMIWVKYLLGAAIIYFAYGYYMKGMGVAKVEPKVASGILLGTASIFFSVYMGLFAPWPQGVAPNEKMKKALSVILFIFGVHFFFNGLGQSGILLRPDTATGASVPHSGMEAPRTDVQGNLVWQREVKKARALAREQGRPVFIDFYADWCANCVAFKKLSLSNKELNLALGRVVLLKIYDTDPVFKEFQNDPKYPELKTGLPFFVILKPDGGFFWKGTQYDAVHTMRKMLEAASG